MGDYALNYTEDCSYEISAAVTFLVQILHYVERVRKLALRTSLDDALDFLGMRLITNLFASAHGSIWRVECDGPAVCVCLCVWLLYR